MRSVTETVLFVGGVADGQRFYVEGSEPEMCVSIIGSGRFRLFIGLDNPISVEKSAYHRHYLRDVRNGKESPVYLISTESPDNLIPLLIEGYRPQKEVQMKLRDGSIKSPVFCKDCRHFPDGLRHISDWEINRRSVDCELAETLSYVTGEKGHRKCSDKNCDGMCRDFVNHINVIPDTDLLEREGRLGAACDGSRGRKEVNCANCKAYRRKE